MQSKFKICFHKGIHLTLVTIATVLSSPLGGNKLSFIDICVSSTNQITSLMLQKNQYNTMYFNRFTQLNLFVTFWRMKYIIHVVDDTIKSCIWTKFYILISFSFNLMFPYPIWIKNDAKRYHNFNLLIQTFHKSDCQA